MGLLAIPGTEAGASLGASGLFSTTAFITCLFVAQLSSFAIIFKFPRCQQKLRSLEPLLIIYCLFVSAYGGRAWLDDDLYRYMWDGWVTANGLSTLDTLPIKPFLDFPEHIRSKIAYQNVVTVYPPGAQIAFAAMWNLFGANPSAWIWSFGGITGLSIMLLRKIATLHHCPRWVSTFISLNPIIYKEFANSAHLDIIAVFFLAVAMCLHLIIQKTGKAELGFLFITGLMVGVGALVKFWPIFFIAFWPGMTLLRKLFLTLIGCITLLIGFFAFYGSLSEIMLSFASLSYFRSYWVFNPGFTDLIRWVLSFFTSLNATELWWRATYFSNKLSIISLGLLSFLQILRPNRSYAIWGIGLFLGLCSTVNPWYLIWLYLSFLCAGPHIKETRGIKAWLMLSIVAIFSYAYWINLTDPTMLRRTTWVLWLVYLIKVSLAKEFKRLAWKTKYFDFLSLLKKSFHSMHKMPLNKKSNYNDSCLQTPQDDR